MNRTWTVLMLEDRARASVRSSAQPALSEQKHLGLMGQEAGEQLATQP